MTPPRIVTPERAKKIEERLATAKTRILFDGPPSHESGRFVEVEDEHGRSFGAGEWTEQGEFWVLTLTSPRVQADDLRDLLHTLAVEREERRVAEGEAMLLVESVEYKLGKALEENALLQAENTKLRGWVHELSQKREYPKAPSTEKEG